MVERRGSAPRDAGASLALNDLGEIAGSVTGGCVEPSVLGEAQEVLDGGPARLREYGIADESAFEVGLACGGTVGILIARLDTSFIPELQDAVRADRPIAFGITAAGDSIGEQRLVAAATESLLVDVGGETIFVHAFNPRSALYVFGAIDHAAALARVGKLLGYRVTVCDARCLRHAGALPRGRRARRRVARPLPPAGTGRRGTAICVLTHEEKFDVPG